MKLSSKAMLAEDNGRIVLPRRFAVWQS